MDRSSLLVDGQILLYGDVGDPWGWGDGFSASDVAAALAEHGPGDVTVRINSGGGIAFEGVAIYSLLLAHAGAVTTIVDGIAASAASLILMAGAVRQMRDGAMVMIHDASGVTFGTAAGHLRNAAVLDKLSEQYAGIYAARAGMERDAARELMKAETWFSAEEATAQGLATARIEDAAEVTASFDYRVYARAPKGLPTRTRPKPAPQAALSSPPAPAAAPAAPPELTMTTTPAAPPAAPLVPTAATAPATAPAAPVAKDWTADFFTAAAGSTLPVASLNQIVAASDTLEVANAARGVIEAALAAAGPAAPTAPAAPPAAPKAWAGQFYTAAERSGLGLTELNAIVAAAPTLESAKDALIDAMAAGQGAGKPAPSAGHVAPAAPGADKSAGILAAYEKSGGRLRPKA